MMGYGVVKLGNETPPHSNDKDPAVDLGAFLIGDIDKKHRTPALGEFSYGLATFLVDWDQKNDHALSSSVLHGMRQALTRALSESPVNLDANIQLDATDIPDSVYHAMTDGIFTEDDLSEGSAHYPHAQLAKNFALLIGMWIIYVDEGETSEQNLRQGAVICAELRDVFKLIKQETPDPRLTEILANSSAMEELKDVGLNEHYDNIHARLNDAAKAASGGSFNNDHADSNALLIKDLAVSISQWAGVSEHAERGGLGLFVEGIAGGIRRAFSDEIDDLLSIPSPEILVESRPQPPLDLGDDRAVKARNSHFVNIQLSSMLIGSIDTWARNVGDKDARYAVLEAAIKRSLSEVSDPRRHLPVVADEEHLEF